MGTITSIQPDLQARSPWSTLNDVASVEIIPVEKPIRGRMIVPGSKSFTNRALILAAMAKGHSEVTGILRSDDSYWCIDSLRKLGASIEVSGTTVAIDGVGGRWPNPEAELYIGAAGTTARFLPGMLAASRGGKWVVQASRRMSERPMQPLIDTLLHMGAEIRFLGNHGCLPLEMTGTGLRGGRVEMSGSTSSQFISGVLMASPYADSPVTVQIVDHVVQHAYVKITLDMMRQFGAGVEYTADLTDMYVEPRGYRGTNVRLEADASTSCYFLALAAITNGQMRIDNLSYGTNQPDVLLVDLLERMGCKVERGDGFIELQGVKQLQGGFTVSMKEMSDQALTLAAIAPFAEGPITITEVAHIRGHESDRIQAMCECLRTLGIQVEEHHDGLTVHPGAIQPAVLQSFDDHRVAMSLSLIGARVPGIRITDPGCVSKTCPTYFELLQSIGVNVHYT